MSDQPSHVAEKNQDAGDVKRQTKVDRVLRIQSVRPEIRELERALMWAYSMSGDYLEDKGVVVTVSTKGKAHKCTAWTELNRWGDREGSDYHEVNFCAEYLDRDPTAIVASVIHEAVHLYATFTETKDCSKSGRHNKAFKELAEGVFGLVCADPYDGVGYGYTKPSDELRERIEKEFKPDIAALNLFRKPDPEKPKNPKKPSKTKAYECLCVTVRVAAGKELNAVCGTCQQVFVLKGGQEEESSDE